MKQSGACGGKVGIHLAMVQIWTLELLSFFFLQIEELVLKKTEEFVKGHLILVKTIIEVTIIYFYKCLGTKWHEWPHIFSILANETSLYVEIGTVENVSMLIVTMKSCPPTICQD